MKLEKITGEGMLEEGDLVLISRANDEIYSNTVKEVLVINGNEEVVLTRKSNKYFITSLMINGESWAKDVYKVIDDEKESKE